MRVCCRGSDWITGERILKRWAHTNEITIFHWGELGRAEVQLKVIRWVSGRLWGIKLTWEQSSRKRWVHRRPLKSREWLLIGLNAGGMVISIKLVGVSENGGDLLPFLAARVCSVDGFGILTSFWEQGFGISSFTRQKKFQKARSR